MTKKCLGCGSILQCTNPNKNGYYPESKSNPKYCERCFKIKNYNLGFISDLINDSNKLVEIVNDKAKYVFFLVDFLNINEETINRFKSIKVDKTLVISKCDIIPKSVKESNLINWLESVYDIKDNIIFVSTPKKYNTNKIIKIMEDNNIKESYILGYTNSGKSTLINNLVEKYNGNKGIITTSTIPNTTLDFIKTKVGDYTLIDSPGFVLETTLYNKDEIELIKKIYGKTLIKPITYQTKENSIITIEDKVIIKPNTNNSFTLYMSNSLDINKIYKMPNTKLNRYELTIDNDSDLIIKGVGFINIKKKCNIDIYISDISLISVRKSCFRGIL